VVVNRAPHHRITIISRLPAAGLKREFEAGIYSIFGFGVTSLGPVVV
jgi:hypothetical protein